MTRPYGDCYESSLVSAEELQFMKNAVENSHSEGVSFKLIYETLNLSEPISVVHGTAVPPNGIDEGKTIVHAWVEVGDHAIESSNKQLLCIPKADYYITHGITPIRKYTVIEARSLGRVHI